MLNFSSLLLFSDKPKKLAEFYENVLGSKPDWQEGDWSGFRIGDGYITIGFHDKVHGKNQTPERMMFNLETNDVAGEFVRIRGLGAKVIKAPYHPDEAHDMWVATFADPDSNYFQLMSPFETNKPN
jgi:predicted enzyme related to lactoylglutathione lyase